MNDTLNRDLLTDPSGATLVDKHFPRAKHIEEVTPSSFEVFAKSISNMAAWYDSHPAKGIIQPIDAIQITLRDASLAAHKAAEGLVWVAPNTFE